VEQEQQEEGDGGLLVSGAISHNTEAEGTGSCLGKTNQRREWLVKLGVTELETVDAIKGALKLKGSEMDTDTLCEHQQELVLEPEGRPVAALGEHGGDKDRGEATLDHDLADFYQREAVGQGHYTAAAAVEAGVAAAGVAAGSMSMAISRIQTASAHNDAGVEAGVQSQRQEQGMDNGAADLESVEGEGLYGSGDGASVKQQQEEVNVQPFGKEQQQEEEEAGEEKEQAGPLRVVLRAAQGAGTGAGTKAIEDGACSTLGMPGGGSEKGPRAQTEGGSGLTWQEEARLYGWKGSPKKAAACTAACTAPAAAVVGGTVAGELGAKRQQGGGENASWVTSDDGGVGVVNVHGQQRRASRTVRQCNSGWGGERPGGCERVKETVDGEVGGCSDSDGSDGNDWLRASGREHGGGGSSGNYGGGAGGSGNYRGSSSGVYGGRGSGGNYCGGGSSDKTGGGSGSNENYRGGSSGVYGGSGGSGGNYGGGGSSGEYGGNCGGGQLQRHEPQLPLRETGAYLERAPDAGAQEVLEGVVDMGHQRGGGYWGSGGGAMEEEQELRIYRTGIGRGSVHHLLQKGSDGGGGEALTDSGQWDLISKEQNCRLGYRSSSGGMAGLPMAMPGIVQSTDATSASQGLSANPSAAGDGSVGYALNAASDGGGGGFAVHGSVVIGPMLNAMALRHIRGNSVGSTASSCYSRSVPAEGGAREIHYHGEAAALTAAAGGGDGGSGGWVGAGEEGVGAGEGNRNGSFTSEGTIASFLNPKHHQVSSNATGYTHSYKQSHPKGVGRMRSCSQGPTQPAAVARGVESAARRHSVGGSVCTDDYYYGSQGSLGSPSSVGSSVQWWQQQEQRGQGRAGTAAAAAGDGGDGPLRRGLRLLSRKCRTQGTAKHRLQREEEEGLGEAATVGAVQQHEQETEREGSGYEGQGRSPAGGSFTYKSRSLRSEGMGAPAMPTEQCWPPLLLAQQEQQQLPTGHHRASEGTQLTRVGTELQPQLPRRGTRVHLETGPDAGAQEVSGGVVDMGHQRGGGHWGSGGGAMEEEQELRIYRTGIGRGRGIGRGLDGVVPHMGKLPPWQQQQEEDKEENESWGSWGRQQLVPEQDHLAFRQLDQQQEQCEADNQEIAESLRGKQAAQAAAAAASIAAAAVAAAAGFDVGLVGGEGGEGWRGVQKRVISAWDGGYHVEGGCDGGGSAAVDDLIASVRAARMAVEAVVGGCDDDDIA
jgi:hypothetical protein